MGSFLIINQAGVLWGDLYEFADVNNITLPGGADATVGAAGGFIQVSLSCFQFSFPNISFYLKGGGHRYGFYRTLWISISNNVLVLFQIFTGLPLIEW